ncbi:MAG: APC family permease [Terriglobia bacterium]|jgi:amino acid transporter
MREYSEQAMAYSAPPVPRLRRVLKLWDLIFYGIIVIQPIAAVPLFGVAQTLSRGHTVTAILIAMLAMLLTAVSYGRMAALYPSAGSAYTYVGRGLNWHLGFLAGWAMFMDYLLNPLICTIYVSLTIQRIFPFIPYVGAAVGFILLITVVNLRGIRTTARTNIALVAVMSVVIGAFVLLAIRYLFRFQGWSGLISYRPFYDSSQFQVQALVGGTSFAALTYIGFDGITTLAEDVENPRRNVLLATVLVCVFTGLFSGLQVYLAQRVWPDYRNFPNLETAFMDVTRRVGGPLLFHALGVIMIVGGFGAAMGTQLGAARLLFGMGRDNVVPRRIFAYLDPKRNTPNYNIIFIALFAFAGAMTLTFEQGAEAVNFGAFLSFMGVNLAALWQFYILPQQGRKRRFWADAFVPGLGFLFCLGIWVGLRTPAKMIGGVWFLLGFAYLAFKTRGFRTELVMTHFGDA